MWSKEFHFFISLLYNLFCINKLSLSIRFSKEVLLGKYFQSQAPCSRFAGFQA